MEVANLAYYEAKCIETAYRLQQESEREPTQGMLATCRSLAEDYLVNLAFVVALLAPA